MIICEVIGCGKVATVHLTEIVQGQKKEIHLCSGCAKDKGITLKPFFALKDMMGSLASVDDDPHADKVKCESCGISYSEFKQHGRLGCANDYEAFKTHLSPFLEKVHNSLFHCGKVPFNTQDQVKSAQKIVRLRKILAEAIKSEDFEEAARIRDELKQIAADE